MALEVAGSKPVTRPISPDNLWGKTVALTDLSKRMEDVILRSRWRCAGVAELVDALVLGTSGESRGGSSPSARTI